MEHHVAAHHDGHAPAGERRTQLVQVLRIGDIHREILRENTHMEHVRHRHGGDPPPQPVGLCFLRPRELVDGEHHLEAQIPYGVDDALVGQGEGVEGAGEERHRARLPEVEAPVEQPLFREEPVQLPQHEGAVIERQPLAGELVLCRQQLPLGEHKGAVLLVPP